MRQWWWWDRYKIVTPSAQCWVEYHQFKLFFAFNSFHRLIYGRVCRPYLFGSWGKTLQQEACIISYVFIQYWIEYWILCRVINWILYWILNTLFMTFWITTMNTEYHRFQMSCILNTNTWFFFFACILNMNTIRLYFQCSNTEYE